MIDITDKALCNGCNRFSATFLISKNFYFNSFFMNKIGRLKFTEQVLKDLSL